MAYIPPLDLSDDSCEKSEARPENFAKRLRCALKIRNISQSELCKMTGIPKSAVSQYVNGAFEPRKKPLKQIAKALNVNEPWLMGWDVPMARYDGTPEASTTAKNSSNENQYQEIRDILCNQIKLLAKQSQTFWTEFPETLSKVSDSMAELAKVLYYLK